MASHDDYGTLIEVFPTGSEMVPGQGTDPAGFCRNAHPYRFIAAHAAISVPISQDEIAAIGHREGWRLLRCEQKGAVCRHRVLDRKLSDAGIVASRSRGIFEESEVNIYATSALLNFIIRLLRRLQYSPSW